MFVGEVIGNVWGQYKHKSLKDRALLLVRPIDPISEEPIGEAVLAVDGGVHAGPGSVVLVMDEGGGARMILGDESAPIRTVICGIVDTVTRRGSEKRYA